VGTLGIKLHTLAYIVEGDTTRNAIHKGEFMEPKTPLVWQRSSELSVAMG
jgi:hypothetical protein